MGTIIRSITRDDNAALAAIIKTVMPEFGANVPGFAIHDPEVNDMFHAYSKTGAAYFVLEKNGKVVGGAGIDRLKGGGDYTCELQKMYFMAEVRQRGLGQQMLTHCLDAARDFGYRECYIETFHTMHMAIRLYEKNGFVRIPGPLGATGHFACDTFYMLSL